MKKILNWIFDKTLSSVLAGLILYFIIKFIELPAKSKTPFLDFNWLYDILNSNISFYYVLIIIAIMIVISRVEKYQYKRNDKKNKNNVPIFQFDYYRKDSFGKDKSNWTWEYEWNQSDEKFSIINLRPDCKRCGTPIDFDRSINNSSYLECSKCRLEGNYAMNQFNERYDDVYKEIIRKIQSNEVPSMSN